MIRAAGVLFAALLLSVTFAGTAVAADAAAASNAASAANATSSPPEEDWLFKSAVPGMTFEIEGVRWAVHLDALSGKLYFHNTANDETQWGDPRVAERRQRQSQLSPRDRRFLWGITVVPGVALFIAIAARVVYLQKYYPELLWPTKERKIRHKYRNKEKAPKSRFKMSQDGKGGRSANS